MNFDREFFEDEIRNGFYVTAEMKQAWAAQIEVLDDFDKACRENGLEYFADWGTMLGAVRHGGFIPWDDDIDVCMKRPDYDKLNKIAKSILPQNYDIFSIYSDGDNDNMVTRIINSRTISFDKERLEKYHGFPYIAGIDIFPFDYVAPTDEELEFQKEIIGIVESVKLLIRKLNSNDIQGKNREDLEQEIEDYIQGIEKICAVTIDRDKNLAQQMNIFLDRLCSLYKESEAKEIAPILRAMKDRKYRFPKEYYTNPVRLKFENITVPVPREYDKILTTYYGDYNKIVLEFGNVHEYPYFEKYKKVARQYNAALISFDADKREYEDILREKENNRETKINNNHEHNGKKKIVFMPFKAKYWSTMAPLWEKYSNNDEYDVVVQPIPFYYKNIDGTLEKYIEMDSYPHNIKLTSYEYYNYEEDMTDEIIIQNPYDEYNIATTVEPMYYTKKLVMNTYKLTYIPYFVTNEISYDDMRSDSSMKSYVIMPGVVYSDRVIVQSENIKKLYIRKLVQFYGEETRQQWDNKLCTLEHIN
jgi:phosphorylcholine metabolism protein LicD